MARKISKRSNHSAPPARTASRAENLPKSTKRRAKSAPGNQQVGSRSFPIVGIGASAGGLEAYTAFLKHLPSDSGMAFVLIQHLDPKQHSELSDLLSKATSMPVTEVNAHTSLETNHVYVIAPGVSLSMSDGNLRAEDRASSSI